MTPAILCARNAGILFSVRPYPHGPAAAPVPMEQAAGSAPAPASAAPVFRTVVIQLDARELAVCVLPAAQDPEFSAIATLLGAKQVQMGDPVEVERATGYLPEYASPLGQKRTLRTVIDVSALRHGAVQVCAGRRGLGIELAVRDLARLTHAMFAAIARSGA